MKAVPWPLTSVCMCRPGRRAAAPRRGPVGAAIVTVSTVYCQNKHKEICGEAFNTASLMVDDTRRVFNLIFIVPNWKRKKYINTIIL